MRHTGKRINEPDFEDWMQLNYSDIYNFWLEYETHMELWRYVKSYHPEEWGVWEEYDRFSV